MCLFPLVRITFGKHHYPVVKLHQPHNENELQRDSVSSVESGTAGTFACGYIHWRTHGGVDCTMATYRGAFLILYARYERTELNFAR